MISRYAYHPMRPKTRIPWRKRLFDGRRVGLANSRMVDKRDAMCDNTTVADATNPTTPE